MSYKVDWMCQTSLLGHEPGHTWGHVEEGEMPKQFRPRYVKSGILAPWG